MISPCKQTECCGCSACLAVCPKQAITLAYDKYGFLMPSINQNKCVDCGLCFKVCQSNSRSVLLKPQKCFAAIRKNKTERMDSASGGISSLLYETFLSSKNTVAYGVAYSNELVPSFISIKGIDDIFKTRGSKYIFARIEHIFKDVSCALNSGFKVLFTGLPCQVAAVKNYLSIKKIDSNNIYYCDIFCHGVSSDKYFLQNIEYYKKKYKLSSIENVTFRSNRRRKNFRFVIYGTKHNKQKIVSRLIDEDYYFYGFLEEGLTLRESCYYCPHSTSSREGDLSLGDFIGFDLSSSNYRNNFDSNLSCILVNSRKGFELLDSIKSDCFIEERCVEEAVKGGASLQKPYPMSAKRKVFLNEYSRTQDFIKAIETASNKHVMKYRFRHSLIRFAKDFYCLKIRDRNKDV